MTMSLIANSYRTASSAVPAMSMNNDQPPEPEPAKDRDSSAGTLGPFFSDEELVEMYYDEPEKLSERDRERLGQWRRRV